MLELEMPELDDASFESDEFGKASVDEDGSHDATMLEELSAREDRSGLVTEVPTDDTPEDGMLAMDDPGVDDVAMADIDSSVADEELSFPV